jgi:hypothetical protein
MRLYAAVYDLIDPSISVLARAMSGQPLRRRFAESIGCTVRLGAFPASKAACPAQPMSVGNVRIAFGARTAWHAHVSKPLPGGLAAGSGDAGGELAVRRSLSARVTISRLLERPL